MIQQMTNEQIALSLADNRSRSPEETIEIAERYYKWLEGKKVSPQDPAIEINPNPKGIDIWKDLYERYKLTEKEGRELKEYRDMIDRGNKQYFNSTVPLK